MSNSARSTQVTCPICGNPVRTVMDKLVGYRSDLVFTVVECMVCGLSCALPAVANNQLYQWIYDNIERVPGYSRYHSYFSRVKSEPFPLAYLANQEEAYWACEAYLQNARNRFPKKPRILEVGCGAGYLSYALRHAGYEVTGCDISASAIAKATEAFGSFYKVIDIESTDLQGPERYDIVLMMEIIEHISNPVQFLNAAKRLLAPGGEIFLTTPNKDALAGAPGWATELPPVHLYWFTARSFESLAKRVGCSVGFCDFSAFFETRYILKQTGNQGIRITPTFSPDGTILIEPKPDAPKTGRVKGLGRRMADSLGLTSHYRKIRDQLAGRERWIGERGPTLAVWLKPDATWFGQQSLHRDA